MEINDTLQLSAVAAPEGVKFVADDPEEVTIATLSPPRVEEEPEPEVEEEAELVGEEGEAPEGEEGGEAAEGDGRLGGDSDEGVAPVALSPPATRRAASEGDRILIVGLGNPGRAATPATRHNVGFEVAAELSRRWDLPRAKKKFGGLIAEGRAGPGGPRVAVLLPQTYMNDSGDSAGPARGSLKVPLDRVVVLHDEIDLPFGEVQARLGGGLAGHNGLKSLKRGLRRRPTSGASGSASAGPTRPTPRSSPPTCSAASASRATEVEALVGRRRRRGRAPGRAARFRA